MLSFASLGNGSRFLWRGGPVREEVGTGWEGIAVWMDQIRKRGEIITGVWTSCEVERLIIYEAM